MTKTHNTQTTTTKTTTKGRKNSVSGDVAGVGLDGPIVPTRYVMRRYVWSQARACELMLRLAPPEVEADVAVLVRERGRVVVDGRERASAGRSGGRRSAMYISMGWWGL